ncbi:MAG: TetR/AcrR family transcriptional regulator [Ignavibacteriaceae bacterium]|nr:TetR/AcrR family transcriptional regulator [Ignavibacteriaceae bacterium]NUM69676.1 TetR/AcrR family transcriptional regulator [Ignavibacteriaceae bacterium]
MSTNSRNKREQILKAAERRFMKHGPHRTTLDEVARDLRMAKSTIYHYFSSKEDLYIKTVEKQGEEYIARIKEIFNNEQKSYEERVRDYIDHKLNLRLNFRLIYLLLLNDMMKKTLTGEEETLIRLFSEEEKIVRLVLNSRKDPAETERYKLSYFITTQTFLLTYADSIFLSKISADDPSVLNTQISIFEALFR